jgi:ribosomal protein S18 acetylase RimI-like enzyme
MRDRARRFAIRRAHANDVHRVAPLFDAYRQFYGASPDLAAARDFIAARLGRDESVVLLAVTRASDAAPEEAVGFAQLYPSFSSVSLGAVVVLNDLYVKPEWRRTRVARSLVEEAARHGERVGAIRVELSTQNTNAPALSLYESLRFSPEHEFTHMSLPLRPPGAAT